MATTPAAYHRQMALSLSSASTASSASSSRASTPDLCDDAITPAPCAMPAPAPEAAAEQQQQQQQQQQQHHSRRSSVGSASSSSSSHDAEDDTAQLWRRMLAAQRRFRCYHSARMEAALENDEVAGLIPSRYCLDLLNESIAKLPDEARREVTAFLEGSRTSSNAKGSGLLSRRRGALLRARAGLCEGLRLGEMR